MANTSDLEKELDKEIDRAEKEVANKKLAAPTRRIYKKGSGSIATLIEVFLFFVWVRG